MRHIRLDSDSLVDDVTSPNASQIVESRRGSTGDPTSPHQEAGILGTPTEETPTVPAFNIALCMNATIQEELIHMIGGSADERDKIRSLLHLQPLIQTQAPLQCVFTLDFGQQRLILAGEVPDLREMLCAMLSMLLEKLLTNEFLEFP